MAMPLQQSLGAGYLICDPKGRTGTVLHKIPDRGNPSCINKMDEHTLAIEQ